jgi:hypothetical protein
MSFDTERLRLESSMPMFVHNFRLFINAETLFITSCAIFGTTLRTAS